VRTASIPASIFTRRGTRGIGSALRAAALFLASTAVAVRRPLPLAPFCRVDKSDRRDYGTCDEKCVVTHTRDLSNTAAMLRPRKNP